MGYGDRYITVHHFTRYCDKLNIKTDEKELEYYESKGLMLPTARLVFPEGYIQERHRRRFGDEQNTPLRDWPEIDDLFDRSLVVDEDYTHLTDDELIDSFDRAFGRNPYLIQPQVAGFKPWKSYRVVVDTQRNVTEPTQSTYYSYWQAHQLYRIQQYPDLYKNRRLIEQLPDKLKERRQRGFLLDEEFFRTLNGNARFFDALSFFITMYYRERKRTFAIVPITHQTRRLTYSQYQAHLVRLAQHAHTVASRYGLAEADLLRFLAYLVDLHQQYRKVERYKLADEIKSDVLYQAQFIMQLTGKSWDEIGDSLRYNTILGTREAFLALDNWTRTKNRAIMVLRDMAKEHSANLGKQGITAPTYTFSDTDAEDVIRFCIDADLTVLLEALEGVVAIGEEEVEKKFTRSGKYQTLKNLTTSFEYLLKAIDARGPQSLTGILTFRQIIDKMMQNETTWISIFKIHHRLTGGKTPQDFDTNLSTLLNVLQVLNSEANFIARCFLIACLARNLSVHFFPTDDWFYGELFGDMMQATIYAVLYTWRISKKEGWV